MTLIQGVRARACALFFLCVMPLSGLAGEMDPDMAWPLCGRITEAPPGGWVEADGCPVDRFGNAAHSDEPLSATTAAGSGRARKAARNSLQFW